MADVLAGLGQSIRWRLRRLRDALYSKTELVFWVSAAEDAPWYPDLDRVAEIARTVGFRARKATEADLDLFRRYHVSFGRRLRYPRIRVMRKRWHQGDECYVALDQQGEIAAQLWVAYDRYVIEGQVRHLGPDEAYHYGVDTRPDQRGSMAFVSCICENVLQGWHTGRRRVVMWGEPAMFEQFRRLNAWFGLGRHKPLRLETWTRVCGFRFSKSRELDENWSYERTPKAAR